MMLRKILSGGIIALTSEGRIHKSTDARIGSAGGTYEMHMDVSGWGWVWMAMMMIFWAVVILALVLAVARGFGQHQQAPAASTPQEILARRLANGEITQEEYRSTLALLSQPQSRGDTPT